MAPATYDIITIGGGLGGSAIAKAMAERGARVLVLEAEARFRDRVRGEAIMPWGVAEAKELRLYDTIMASGGHQLPWWDMYQGPNKIGHRDLPRTTAPQMPVVAFYHPEMQAALIHAAVEAGAEVRRGSRVRSIRSKDAPTLVVDEDGHEAEIRARLVVGADGRASMARDWGGFHVQRDRDQNLVAGVLFDGASAPDDASHFWLNSPLGMTGLIFPQGHGRVRTYVCYRAGRGYRYSGSADIPRFIEDLSKTGVPEEYYGKASAAGPLATFDGASAWVEHPYRNGVALVGDAAAASDPTWGQGLSLTLRDVRVLRDQLLSHENWDEAGNAYAEEHDRYYTVLHTFESWDTKMLMETGPEAEARREMVFPLWQEDRSRIPDIFLSGPDRTLDETARRRFFGEE